MAATTLALALALSPSLARALDLLQTGFTPLVAVSPVTRLEPAPPFHLESDGATRARAVNCLADAVYYEAGGESREGREAVAQVVLNRVRHPNYPKSVCGVVFEGAARTTGCQFTFTCDGSMRRTPGAVGWRDAVEVASAALDGFVSPSVGGSTHYHAVRVRPAWSAAMTPTRRIGAHQFYRLPGALGSVLALVGAYAGAEPETTRAAGAVRFADTDRFASDTFRALPHAAPQTSRFSVWGVTVADVSPQRDGSVSVASAAAAP